MRGRLRMSPSIKDCAIAILRKQNRPLHYKDILKMILKVRPIAGLTPHKSLYAALKRDKGIQRVGAGTFIFSTKRSLSEKK